MKLSLPLLSVAWCLFAVSVCSAADTEIKLEATPAAVQKSLKKIAGSNKVLKVEKADDEGKTHYEILTANGSDKKIEYIFSPDGSLAATEKVMGADELPAEVKATATEAIGKGKMGKIEKITEESKITYEIDYKSPKGEKMEAVVSAQGKLLKNSEDKD